MKLFKYFFISLFLLPFCFAGQEAGNGGSENEAKRVSVEAEIKSVALKIQIFFTKNPGLESEFYEFDRNKLISTIGTASIKVVDDKLVDKFGETRTCLNFPLKLEIICNLDFQKLDSFPRAKFVLILHEVLGLLGVEENIPSRPQLYLSYEISSKLAKYVSKIANYDLRISNEGDNDNCGQIKTKLVVGAEYIIESDYVITYVSPYAKLKKISNENCQSRENSNFIELSKKYPVLIEKTVDEARGFCRAMLGEKSDGGFAFNDIAIDFASSIYDDLTKGIYIGSHGHFRKFISLSEDMMIPDDIVCHLKQ